MSNLAAIEQALIEAFPFCPQPGPQEQAYFSEADVVLYGGAAGGGKTALACGMAIQEHQETLFVRRESKQLDGVADELERMLGNRDGLTHSGGAPGKWLTRISGKRRKITFGSCPHLGDENRYQGRPRDLLVVDEAANMLEDQVSFLMGWVRTTDPSQKCRVLLCSNPPTGADGEWLIRWFSPWLDPNHPNPAIPGEIRWFAVINGERVEVDGPDPIYNDKAQDEVDRYITPQSYTFIPAKVSDNKYLMGTGYVTTLQGMPEPLRSQLLYGSFTAGRVDDEWQTIPSEWVQAAMDRWEERPWTAADVTSMGVDPSRGGADSTILAPRIGWHYPKLKELKGEDTSNGIKVAAKVIGMVGGGICPVHVDVIGIGSSVVDQLEVLISTRCVPIVASEGVTETDVTGKLRFLNVRARDWWRMRMLLDPAGGANIALPPDQALKAELCAPRYTVRSGKVQIESKDDVKKRIGRSTDRADAVILASYRTPIIQINQQPVKATGSMDRHHGQR